MCHIISLGRDKNIHAACRRAYSTSHSCGLGGVIRWPILSIQKILSNSITSSFLSDRTRIPAVNRIPKTIDFDFFIRFSNILCPRSYDPSQFTCESRPSVRTNICFSSVHHLHHIWCAIVRCAHLVRARVCVCILRVSALQSVSTVFTKSWLCCRHMQIAGRRIPKSNKCNCASSAVLSGFINSCAQHKSVVDWRRSAERAQENEKLSSWMRLCVFPLHEFKWNETLFFFFLFSVVVCRLAVVVVIYLFFSFSVRECNVQNAFIGWLSLRAYFSTIFFCARVRVLPVLACNDSNDTCILHLIFAKPDGQISKQGVSRTKHILSKCWFSIWKKKREENSSWKHDSLMLPSIDRIRMISEFYSFTIRIIVYMQMRQAQLSLLHIFFVTEK